MKWFRSLLSLKRFVRSNYTFATDTTLCLFLSLLFRAKSVLYFLWTVWKCLSTFPFFGIVMVVWQIRQMHFEKDNKKVFWGFYLVQMPYSFCWYQFKALTRSLSSLVFCNSDPWHVQVEISDWLSCTSIRWHRFDYFFTQCLHKVFLCHDST